MSKLPSQPSSPRYEKLLHQEVLACEDPICCCEAEPRWLLFEHEGNNEPGLCDWEGIERVPSEEL